MNWLLPTQCSNVFFVSRYNIKYLPPSSEHINSEDDEDTNFSQNNANNNISEDKKRENDKRKN